MRRVLVVASVVALLVMLPASALAATSGSVAVTVSAAAPCLTVSGAFNYGALVFSTNGTVSQSGQTVGPSITNCSGTSENFLARVSNLTGGQATWTPAVAANPCTAGVNQFDLNAAAIGPGNIGPFDLTTADQGVGTLTTATPWNWGSIFEMPCTGSAGAGVPMSGTIFITASF